MFAVCSPPLTMVNSTGTSATSVLTAECATEWRAEEGETGAGAELVLDLLSSHILSSVTLINGGKGAGVEQFSLWGANTLDGEWKHLLSSEMEEDKVQLSHYSHSILWSKLYLPCNNLILAMTLYKDPYTPNGSYICKFNFFCTL